MAFLVQGNWGSELSLVTELGGNVDRGPLSLVQILVGSLWTETMRSGSVPSAPVKGPRQGRDGEGEGEKKPHPGTRTLFGCALKAVWLVRSVLTSPCLRYPDQEYIALSHTYGWLLRGGTPRTLAIGARERTSTVQGRY